MKLSPTNRRRMLAVVALAIGAGTLGLLAFGNLGENLVYYWSPSELASAGDEARGAVIRLGGLVAEDSVTRSKDGLVLDFAVTDGAQSVRVHAEAVPPAMFREGIGVVLEGTMGADGVFQTDRLMVKHDNEYRAPDEEETRSMEELVKSMQFDKSDT